MEDERFHLHQPEQPDESLARAANNLSVFQEVTHVHSTESRGKGPSN